MNRLGRAAPARPRLPGPAWPVELAEGAVSLHPIRYSDGREWREVHQRNREWLRPWEATVPPGTVAAGRLTFRQMTRMLRHEAAAGRMMPFVVRHAVPDARGRAAQRLVGQITVAGITWGALCSAHIGYWIDERMAGRGVIPMGVALAVDHCFTSVGLHRVEVCIRPENTPSRRVVEKLGFREEGIRARYLHIDGAWRDHVTYAITAEEVPQGLVTRWRSQLGTAH